MAVIVVVTISATCNYQLMQSPWISHVQAILTNMLPSSSKQIAHVNVLYEIEASAIMQSFFLQSPCSIKLRYILVVSNDIQIIVMAKNDTL